AMIGYLGTAPPGDAAWALFFLTGRRVTRLLPARLLHAWTLELTGLPEWLLRDCYAAVGDYAETVALLLDGRLPPLAASDIAPPSHAQRSLFEEAAADVDSRVDEVGLQEWIERRVLPLRHLGDAERRVRVMTWWSRLDRRQLYLLN